MRILLISFLDLLVIHFFMAQSLFILQGLKLNCSSIRWLRAALLSTTSFWDILSMRRY